ncbi:hypothetical protein Afil01_57660 [Actinorhabdospora filicis]|uniref:O-antigen/teichoic acid export membrane protein n=1 Tax=Actinorhabdospora filicis TaxID=1785913 RepID=A0A9W6WBT6_9ACTN|nr:MATE family efflux transporter [Actinorhabdospora filicis]GLZ80959.1 hypothetical protein Afil01_57660 [Actinorhabdospora filicis]
MTAVGGPRAGDETTAHRGGQIAPNDGPADDAMLLWEAVREAARHAPGARSASWGPVHPGFAGLPGFSGGLGIGADPPEVEWLAAASTRPDTPPPPGPIATFRAPGRAGEQPTTPRQGERHGGERGPALTPPASAVWRPTGESGSSAIEHEPIPGTSPIEADWTFTPDGPTTDAAHLHAALTAPDDAGGFTTTVSPAEADGPSWLGLTAHVDGGELAARRDTATDGFAETALPAGGDGAGYDQASVAAIPEAGVVRQRAGEGGSTADESGDIASRAGGDCGVTRHDTAEATAERGFARQWVGEKAPASDGFAGTAPPAGGDDGASGHDVAPVAASPEAAVVHQRAGESDSLADGLEPTPAASALEPDHVATPPGGTGAPSRWSPSVVPAASPAPTVVPTPRGEPAPADLTPEDLTPEDLTPTDPPPSTPTPPKSDSLRGVARGGVANLAGSAVSGAAGLGITWLVAAALGPAGAGLFFAATSAFLITTSLSRLGTPTGLVYWIARLRSDGVTSFRKTLRVGLTPVVALSVALGVAGYFLAPALAGAYSPDPAHTDEYARLLRLLAVFVPAATILDVLLAATRGMSTMKPTVYIERLGRTLLQVALLALAVALAGDGGAADAVTLAWAAPFVPAMVAAAIWLRKRRGPATGEGPTPREFWTYTGPRALGSLAQLALQRLDILLVAGMLGFREAALYTVATRFVIAGQLANLAVGSSLQPRIAAALSPKNGAMRDPGTARRLYRHTTSWIILLAWPMYLTAAVLAPEYLRLFGAEYDTPQAVVIVRVMAAAMLVASACGTVDSVLSMSGRTSWQLSNVLTALAANIAVDLWLIPRVGVAGAALGWAAAVLANNLIPLAQLGFAERLHPFGRESAIAMGLAAFCFGALPVTAIALGAPGVGAAIGGGLVYALSLWRLRGPLLTKHVSA